MVARATNSVTITMRESGTFFVIATVLLAAPAVTSLVIHKHFWPAAAIAALMLGTAWSLSSLQVLVGDGRLRVQLGGLITVRNVALADIAGVQRFRVPSVAGLGVRWLTEGTLYTVTWGDAVEIRLRDGTRFFVGSDTPDAMCATLQSAIAAAT